MRSDPAAAHEPRTSSNATRTDASGVRRVVLVLPTYLPESFGGAEQQSRKLALALRRLGVAVTILAPRLSSATPKRENFAGVAVRRFKLRHAPNLGGRHLGSLLLWSVKLSWWLAVHRRRYDVVHVIHGRLHAVPAVVTSAMLGKPSLVKIGRGGLDHFDLDLVRNKRLVGPWYARLIVRRASSYVANSREIVDDLRRWGIPPERIHEIPNGVELPPPSARAAAAPTAFVYVGRLDREKAIDLMIRGFKELPPSAACSLTIVGDGECRTELERLVDELELRGRVRFTGPLSDVAPALRDADVFVSTSLSEGMSNALLEAMSAGLMPLVSRVSGVADIVEPGRSGLLFEPGDLASFVTRLRQTVEMDSSTRRAFGEEARETMERRFAIDAVARRHVELYDHLAETHARMP